MLSGNSSTTPRNWLDSCPYVYWFSFINKLVSSIPMPGHTPDLPYDRVSRLTTDSLSMRYSHKHLLVLSIGLRLADGYYLFSARLSVVWSKALLGTLLLIIWLPTRNSCPDSTTVMAEKLAKLRIPPQREGRQQPQTSKQETIPWLLSCPLSLYNSEHSVQYTTPPGCLLTVGCNPYRSHHYTYWLPSALLLRSPMIIVIVMYSP